MASTLRPLQRAMNNLLAIKQNEQKIKTSRQKTKLKACSSRKEKKRYQQKSIINYIIASKHVAKTKDPSPMSSLLSSEPDATYIMATCYRNEVVFESKSTHLNSKIVTEFILIQQFLFHLILEKIFYFLSFFCL
jgi:hypothetical protein